MKSSQQVSTLTLPAEQLPLVPSEGRTINQGEALNPQRDLSDDQQALKGKSLSERACASLNTDRREMETFVQNLADGKFEPGSLRKIILWLCSKFGGPEYEVAVKQFTAQTAAAEHKGLFFRQEDFLNDLAAAVKGCDSSELPQVLHVVHNLLFTAPEARKDFLINKLFLPCLEEAHTEMSRDEINVKNSTEKYKIYFTIYKFCIEQSLLTPTLNKVSDLLPTLAEKAIYFAITASTQDEKNQYLQCLSEIRENQLDESLEGTCSSSFDVVDKMHGNFTEILQCFGENQNKQVESFETLVDNLKSIRDEVWTEYKECQGRNDDFDVSKNFVQKGSKFLLENPRLMWAALKMKKQVRFFGRIYSQNLSISQEVAMIKPNF
ncbi:MAG: hypothetical protein LBS22_00675 [Puniceicoccales bacterium]|jgi:hypothetical protein|nr:hypothetical protein [Puniceicoccales bacterium]